MGLAREMANFHRGNARRLEIDMIKAQAAQKNADAAMHGAITDRSRNPFRETTANAAATTAGAAELRAGAYNTDVEQQMDLQGSRNQGQLAVENARGNNQLIGNWQDMTHDRSAAQQKLRDDEDILNEQRAYNKANPTGPGQEWDTFEMGDKKPLFFDRNSGQLLDPYGTMVKNNAMNNPLPTHMETVQNNQARGKQTAAQKMAEQRAIAQRDALSRSVAPTAMQNADQKLSNAGQATGPVDFMQTNAQPGGVYGQGVRGSMRGGGQGQGYGAYDKKKREGGRLF